MSEETYVYRKFGGKQYGIYAIRQTRAQAVIQAKKAREHGYLARMIKLPGIKKNGQKGILWAVYHWPLTTR